MAHTDVELIQRILQGDQDALSPLVKKYQKGVHTLAWRKIGDFHIAQEITQDAFLTAYKKLRTLKNHNQFAGWLYVIAANLCRDWLKKSRLPMDSLDITDANEVDKVSYSRYVAEKQKADADETRREVVKKLLQKLPESERTVMMLHYLGEMTIKAISEFLGVSQNTVKSRLSRARNRLRKEEDVIQQNLGSFQLPDSLAENIMQEVSRMAPVPPAVSKPVAPLAISAASAVLLFLLMGVGTQYLSRFQKPYNFSATSEPTVEIIDAVFVIDSPAKPALRSQAGSSAIPGKSPGAGQESDESLVATLPIDTTEVSTPKPQWNQTKGPEGGNVQNLFVASNGDFYAEADTGLYRLADDKSRWGLVNANMPINGSSQMTEHNSILYIVSDEEVLTSIDRGETWNPLGARPEGQLIDLVITDGIPGEQTDITMYLGLVDGVFRSVDAGKSWDPVSDRLVDKEIRAITTIEDVVFVGTDSGLYRRNSEGWGLLPLGESENVSALASTEHLLYVAVGDAMNRIISPNMSMRFTDDTSLSLYRSADLGDSWKTLPFMKADPEPMTTDPLEGFGVIINSGAKNNSEPKDSDTETITFVKIVAAEESLLVLDSGSSYYSPDAGENWVTLGLNNPDMGGVSTIAPLDANTFYRSGQSGIYRTTDAGKTWHQFNRGLVRTTVMNLVSAHGGLYANIGQSVFTSSDNGESWTLIPDSPRNVTNLAQFNDVLYARSGEGMKPRLFRLSTEERGLILVPGMPALKTPDYGTPIETKILTVQDENLQNPQEDTKLNLEDYSGIIEESMAALLSSLFGSFAVSGDTYYMEYEQRLFRWKPDTAEWSDTRLIDEGEPIDITDSSITPDTLHFKLVVSGSTVYVGKRDGHLFQSFDEGNTWNDVTASLPFPIAYFRAVTFAGSTVYVATDKGVAFSNDGVHWHATTDTEGAPILIERFAIGGTMLYGTSERHVYRFKENTGVWEQVAPEIPMPITSLAVEGSILYVGTDGSGVLRFKLDD